MLPFRTSAQGAATLVSSEIGERLDQTDAEAPEGEV